VNAKVVLKRKGSAPRRVRAEDNVTQKKIRISVRKEVYTAGAAENAYEDRLLELLCHRVGPGRL